VEGRKARPLAVDSILQVQEVSKRFGGLAALTNVSVEVARGKIAALIGPNGSGKTTLFNVICGLLPSDGGTNVFDGAPITGLTPHEIVARGLGRTFQQARLFPSLTILENLQIPQHSRGAVGIVGVLAGVRREGEERARARRRAEELLGELGEGQLYPRRHDYPQNLSLGQQRIVEIARALCVDPVLLLLDEPAAGLRHMEKQRLAALLRQLRDGGMSVLLVEHDMGFVMNLADRVVVLDFGTKIAEGTPNAIKTNPDVIKAYLGVSA
jgi:ABC-type branched-subunit amino acid transport system ATPase component